MGDPGGLPSTGSQSRTRLKQLSSSSSLGLMIHKWVDIPVCMGLTFLSGVVDRKHNQ